MTNSWSISHTICDNLFPANMLLLLKNCNFKFFFSIELFLNFCTLQSFLLASELRKCKLVLKFYNKNLLMNVWSSHVVLVPQLMMRKKKKVKICINCTVRIPELKLSKIRFFKAKKMNLRSCVFGRMIFNFCNSSIFKIF
jgi:hypothetical protein